MKHLMIFVAALMMPWTAFADGRIELGDQNADGHNCHAPWSQDDADLEYKNYCEASSLQHADGTYTAQANMSFKRRVPELVDAPIDITGGWDQTVTDCSVTPCTFQNDDGTAFITTNGEIVITYSRPRGRPTDRINIDVEIVLYRAAQGIAAALEASKVAGMSKAARAAYLAQ